MYDHLYEPSDDDRYIDPIMTEPGHAFFVSIRQSDQETLEWLYARGYDAGFLDQAELVDESSNNGVRVNVYGLTEASAWAVNDAVKEDPVAFLTCCGSDTLSGALLAFVDSIV